MKYLVIFPLLLSISLAFKPTQLQYHDLIHQSINENNRVISGLSELGLITVSDIPGYKELREDILLASHHCLNANKESAFLLDLQDGTKRYTMASSSKSGFSEFGGVDISKAECAEFTKLYSNFNGLVDEVVDKFTTLLDRSLLDDEKRTPVMLDTETNEHSYSISDVVSKGTHLEHFHTYEKQTTLRDLYATDYARKLHKDHGLFIVMTPAFTFEHTETNDHGFFVELNNGEIVQPDFGSDGNQLVIMIGDGFVQWLNPKLKQKLTATKHAVSMPYSTAQTSKRSWYGRMILPKDSMFLESQQQTYQEMEQNINSNSKLHEYSVCSQGMVLNPRTLQSCPGDQLACWRDCYDITCGDDEEALCGSFSGEDFVECSNSQDEHGPQCQPTCVITQQTNVRPVVGNDFCNGIIVSMYMDGFSGVKDRSEGCLVFLFPHFVLDSEAKYFLASVVTIFIGITTEGIAYLRRRVASKVTDKSRKNFQRIGLYSLQVIFGYIAMLIAMTYSLLLFAMIVLGLTIGHRMFNFDVKPSEFRDACCVDEEPTDPEHYHQK